MVSDCNFNEVACPRHLDQHFSLQPLKQLFWISPKYKVNALLKNKRSFPYSPASSLLLHYLKLLGHMEWERLFDLKNWRWDTWVHTEEALTWHSLLAEVSATYEILVCNAYPQQMKEVLPGSCGANKCVNRATSHFFSIWFHSNARRPNGLSSETTRPSWALPVLGMWALCLSPATHSGQGFLLNPWLRP